MNKARQRALFHKDKLDEWMNDKWMMMNKMPNFSNKTIKLKFDVELKVIQADVDANVDLKRDNIISTNGSFILYDVDDDD